MQDAITVDYVNPELTLEHGWIFSPTGKSGIDYPSCTRERSGLEPQAEYLYQLYQKGNSEFTGTISVPVLWDKKKQTVVNNDSGQIMEMLNSEFDEISQDSSCPDLFPKELQAELTELNDHMADSINTGVYNLTVAVAVRHTFTNDQNEEYETPCNKLFDELDKLEKRLDGQRYLIPYHPEGRATPCPTLADYRLFTTLIRFDVVYYPLFKTNLRHIRDYPNLQGFMEDLYSDPAIASTVDFAQIKKGYWMSMNLHGPLNPKDRIPLNSEPFLPKGPFHRRALGLLEHSGKPATNGTGKDVTAAGRDEKSKGAFVRKESQHRNWIKADGSTSFTPEAGRYHLYVANGCPWCHRTALTRALLGMQDSVSMDVLFYSRDPDRGWQFKPEAPGCTPDTVNGGMHFIRELYEKENSGEKTVPVLFDKKTKTIVSNESADIIRMFATECQGMHGPGAPDLIPQQPQQLQQLEDINDWVYTDLANGAYKAGFASSQLAYEAAYKQFFVALDRAEALLAKNKALNSSVLGLGLASLYKMFLVKTLRTFMLYDRFLLGDSVSEADVRLFPPIFRFDHIYYLRFLLDRAMISESYPNLQRWMMDFYSLPGVAEASNIDHCKKGYFGRHGNNIVPLGPQLSYSFKH
ncbi:MAG: hypothetical protein FRX49_00888 [Trebouxia sp. A1-2]|nr:MAG: hypothetical protein FRX49_00888 [Trebouxia sp. A1-2]